MAKLKIESVFEHLDYDLRRAMEDTIREYCEQNIDARDFLKSFTRNVGRKCNTWERIPDRYIRVD